MLSIIEPRESWMDTMPSSMDFMGRQITSWRSTLERKSMPMVVVASRSAASGESFNISAAYSGESVKFGACDWSSKVRRPPRLMITSPSSMSCLAQFWQESGPQAKKSTWGAPFVVPYFATYRQCARCAFWQRSSSRAAIGRKQCFPQSLAHLGTR